MKRKIEIADYAGRIMEETGKGILLTTKANGQVNSMTIGWGFLGIQWAKPIFVVLVRQSRHTKKMLDENPEFTINVPLGAVDKNILGVCGTKSGRDMDKIKHLGLTLEEGETVSVPAIKELPLTLECKVIYKQKQDLSAIPQPSIDRFYPMDADGKQDYHIAYFGQIVDAYIIE